MKFLSLIISFLRLEYLKFEFLTEMIRFQQNEMTAFRECRLNLVVKFVSRCRSLLKFT